MTLGKEENGILTEQFLFLCKTEAQLQDGLGS